MKFRPVSDLLMIAAITAVLVVVIVFFPSNVVRTVFGLPFLLLFPGYVIVAALFPRKSDVRGTERLALSFGLSIAVVPIVGLILNYTPWGIALYPMLISLASLVTVTLVWAWCRRRRCRPSKGRSRRSPLCVANEG